MHVTVLTVGKPRAGGLATAMAEYERRAARYWSLDVQDVKEVSSRSRTPEQVMQEEGERLLARVPAGAIIAACDPAGRARTSEAFASWLSSLRDAAHSVAFVIGGAHGLSPAVLARARERVLLAPWTLPHDVARLVLAEQLYRAGTILRGEPYHK